VYIDRWQRWIRRKSAEGRATESKACYPESEGVGKMGSNYISCVVACDSIAFNPSDAMIFYPEDGKISSCTCN
jgi:hypothetical protein